MDKKTKSANAIVCVLGIGDVGSAVAHALFRGGFAVVVHDVAAPLTARRGMAFADAMFDGRASLLDVTAERCDSIAVLEQMLASARSIPVSSLELTLILDRLRPAVLVDARMRKRAVPEPQRALAPLTIGLGPNFVAGDNVHVAIETEWGDRLGVATESGPTAPLRGEPRSITGHGRDRVIYAQRAGRFTTRARIGDRVYAGQVVGRLEDMVLHAPLAGHVRGLLRDGVDVPAGTKVVEIDPRIETPEFTGIGERPRRVAEGVLGVVRARIAL